MHSTMSKWYPFCFQHVDSPERVPDRNWTVTRQGIGTRGTWRHHIRNFSRHIARHSFKHVLKVKYINLLVLPPVKYLYTNVNNSICTIQLCSFRMNWLQDRYFMTSYHYVTVTHPDMARRQSLHILRDRSRRLPRRHSLHWILKRRKL